MAADETAILIAQLSLKAEEEKRKAEEEKRKAEEERTKQAQLTHAHQGVNRMSSFTYIHSHVLV
jgi:ERCC4-type nuclease